jgi:phosphodiesterase/alkaline phosphatase D-like protein
VLTRRDLLIGGAALTACRATGVRVSRPQVTHGLQVGDVSTRGALVWARSSEPARLQLEWDTTERFANPRRVAGPLVTSATDHAATLTLGGLAEAQRIFVRARFDREAARGTSEWASASFAMPAGDRMRIAWTGDTCGQGFGRNPEWGGLRGYAALRAVEPALLINSGDLIYADNPILPEQRTLDGRVWRNVSNDHVARVAETLDDFRARFAYNLDDDHVRALDGNVPGPPAGREIELAAILTELHTKNVRDVVWITADVHYAAAHHYDPARGAGTVLRRHRARGLTEISASCDRARTVQRLCPTRAACAARSPSDARTARGPSRHRPRGTSRTACPIARC